MADIQLRFHHDPLVISTSTRAELKRLGVNVDRDSEFMMLFEPEAFEEIYQVDSMTGAQCLVANTAFLTPAQLAIRGLGDKAKELAEIAIKLVHNVRPQHIFVEVASCGLPLDPSSKSSLLENRNQYSDFAKLFSELEFDAFFLNGFTKCVDLKCALMGIRKVSDMPIIASVSIDNDAKLLDRDESLEDAMAVMAEFGADVVGIATSAGIDKAVSLANRMNASAASALPKLVQLVVERDEFLSGENLGENEISKNRPFPSDDPHTAPYSTPDTMVDASIALRASGVQFLRACGNATPAYAAALVASI